MAHISHRRFPFLGLGVGRLPPGPSGMDEMRLLAAGSAHVSTRLLFLNRRSLGAMLFSFWMAEARGGGQGEPTSSFGVSAVTRSASHPLTPSARASHVPNPESAGPARVFHAPGPAELYKTECSVPSLLFPSWMPALSSSEQAPHPPSDLPVPCFESSPKSLNEVASLLRLSKPHKAPGIKRE